MIVEDEGCWIWQGAREKKGYGEIYFPQSAFPDMKMCRKLLGSKVPAGWRKARVHQLTYFIKYGNIKPGLELAHSCMRRTCCHWDHVLPATMQENYEQKFYPPKLPPDTMAMIEMRIVLDEPYTSIADDYSISVWNVRTIAESLDREAVMRRILEDVPF